MKTNGWTMAGVALAALLLAACDLPEPTATATPAPVSRVALSSGHSHSCALREDGTPICWGDNERGQASPPTGERFIAISSGYSHSCALREDGTPICWGDNEHGQASPPVGERFIAISGHCGLREDGTPVCWGKDALERLPAVAPPAGVRFVAISGRWEGCGLREDGTPVCWGGSFGGPKPTPPAGVRFVAISSGGWHSCGLREDGTPICWGKNEYGQATVPTGERFVAISGGGWHSCALREDGTPVCWGDNRHGQAEPPAGERFTAISSGWWHSCGLLEDYTPVCWGSDSHGQATIWGTVFRHGLSDGSSALSTSATAAEGRTDAATLVIHCDETLRVATVFIAFTMDSIEAARLANETLDEVYISRRASGAAGRWMKTGWDQYTTGGPGLVLRTKPAAAFIAQLTEVEEMAVLAKHDYGPDTAAVFDVRFLEAALASPKVGWAC